MRMLLLILCSFVLVNAANANTPPDTTIQKEKVKTGLTFGAVPAIAFDSDVGFKYGLVTNFYHFGDGSSYPNYKHSLFLEWSRTTKGSGINEILYDSKHLIPNTRITTELSVLTEQALDFYGFNGYNAPYLSELTNEDSPEYLSRLFYRHDRKLIRFRTEFLGNIVGEKLRWIGGFAHYGLKIDSVDVDKLNKGIPDNEKLPYTGGGLYGRYVDWGIIPYDLRHGGNTNLLKLGLVYDTRDNEANSMKGVWTSAQFVLAPSFLGNGDYSFTKLVINHRQYFTLRPKVFNLAYRISYQDKIAGDMPYYMLPFVFNSGPVKTRDGLGGAKTIRGILRNRVVGEDYLYGNIELRYKLIRRIILNQNFYFALSTFLDWGMVTGKYDLPSELPREARNYLAQRDKERPHMGYGLGFNFALNENFIVAINYGIAMDSRDGDSGLYIGMNYLF